MNTTPTREQIAEAEAILKARDEAKYWPIGTVCIANTGWVTIVDSQYSKLSRDCFRAASEAEIEMLKQIPEMKKAMEAK
jgi:hypothetical protein